MLRQRISAATVGTAETHAPNCRAAEIRPPKNLPQETRRKGRRIRHKVGKDSGR